MTDGIHTTPPIKAPRPSSATPSPEQQIVIDTWGKGMAVLAGAGSGKTTTLVSKCVKLMEMNPKARFAAVSFTERSASDLRAKLSQALLASPDDPNSRGIHPHWVMTIHGLCGAIIREYPRQAGFDGEESVLSESEATLLWERAIEALWFDEIPDDVRIGLEKLLDRESRDGLAGLLKRVRELSSFGVLSSLQGLQNTDSRALERVGRFVLERYERSKKRRGAIDFNDLERGAARALEDSQVCEAYHRRFDLILVDEFQDTNPLQARIIWRLARPDVSNLCVVGDPKQSIYRFRDADVTVFEEQCSLLPVRQSLTWNFRSLPGIIDFANQLCEKTFHASGMAFDPLIPKRQLKPDITPVLRLDVDHPNELAEWIKREVSQGLPLHEMALLVRKIRGNEKWFKALTSAGIPIALGSGGLFWEEPRVRELVAFLKWWDNPGNSLSGAIFLRAPWMAISDLEMDRWVKQDPTFHKPFFDSDHPIALQLKLFLNKIVRPGELLMSLMIDQEIEDELGAPLLGLWHRVEELSSRNLDFHAVVTELTTAVQESRREREVPAPRNLGQLSVLTLHGSKGLEFPHVILIDLGSKSRASETPLLFWDRAQGAYLGGRDENGDRDRDNFQESNWRELEKNKNLAESKRLFYVALTRARERLVLVCPHLKNPEEIFEPEVSFSQDYWRAWVECCDSEIPRMSPPWPYSSSDTVRADHDQAQLPNLSNLSIDPLTAESENTEAYFHPKHLPRPKLELSRARHSVTEWTLLTRCPRAYDWTFIHPQPVGDGIPEIGLFTGEKVPTLLENEISHQELGTRIHACLERGDYAALKDLEKEVGTARFLAEPVMSWALSSPWMAPPRPEQGRYVWTELAFEVPLGNEVLVGSIDRVIEEKTATETRYSIIDFKMTEKRKSVGALLDAYQTQLELYAWALTRLEPRCTRDQMSALIVNISSHSIQTVPVAVGNLDPKKLLQTALEIVNGKPGEARPGFMCRYCEFRSSCPEGQKSVTEDESENTMPIF